jgi:hypothetical protein
MKKHRFYGVVGLGALLVVLAGIPPAMATPSFGTEDWIGPQEQAPVVAVATPSFGTEDWIGPQEQAPVVAVATPSYGTEDWIGTMEFSEALGTGAAPAREYPSLDGYNPD